MTRSKISSTWSDSKGLSVTIGVIPHKALSPSEVDKFCELKKLAEAVFQPTDAWGNDLFIYRALVARSYNVEKAFEMIKRILEFRRQNELDNILERYRPPPLLEMYFPTGYLGRDNDGFPILFERIGNADLEGLASGGVESFLDWVKYYHEAQEKIMATSSTPTKDTHKLTAVIDLAHISLRSVTPAFISIVGQRARLEEDNWPEVVSKLILIHVPALFAGVWNVVKGVMDEGTREKVQLVSGDPLPTLTKYMSLDVIPKYLGGNLVDSRGNGEVTAIAGAGGPVPQAYVHGVGHDGLGCGEMVNVHAGKSSSSYFLIPKGSTFYFSYCSDKEIEFSATSYPLTATAFEDFEKARSSTSKKSSLHLGTAVKSSVYGAHLFSEYFSVDKSASSSVDVPEEFVRSVDGVAEFDKFVTSTKGTILQSPVKEAKLHKGSFRAQGEHGDLIKIEMNNSFSWMTGKKVYRRFDVITEGVEHVTHYFDWKDGKSGILVKDELRDLSLVRRERLLACNEWLHE